MAASLFQSHQYYYIAMATTQDQQERLSVAVPAALTTSKSPVPIVINKTVACNAKTQPVKEASLAAMPAELLKSIATFADLQDLPALRLVNRECNSKVLRTFTKTFFTTLPILLCYDKSIKTALEIAGHPIFAPAIRTIDPSIDVIPDEDDYEDYGLNIPMAEP
ncbi:hypothetical protein CLAFUW4_14625 [Fulvia fulva]|uniref:F-box domain-containing protein n=1 Tax=Passalora fulva TaxID=5499 RepID=A0A9Q8PMH0_PASFU|nr:uncharacterized protein CLAFUR5_14454 [Fulvia fulva]KAK4609379.1 hypothetical protein CLAFUR4_14619 [Fulvia fulva]KAK4609567.1 hypothetical protein CLAFUR0_14619 [Fulvia fulva]UJO25173.1 hypothetical protein CLAFUR5_14454 [Fulvia fulva]WPV22543.1 hypothetical protein CLAFUW4_14625 [Fulvia fulva]WPV37690.1 hypothetical protein CLAFUW7_14628 [Fulvia fulva]